MPSSQIGGIWINGVGVPSTPGDATAVLTVGPSAEASADPAGNVHLTDISALPFHRVRASCCWGYHWLASAVTAPTAKFTVFPLARVNAVIAPCRYLSLVAALSQTSAPFTVGHAAPAVHDTAFEEALTPADGAPNAVAPIVLPRAVYPVAADSSVPFAVLLPVVAINRKKNGGVTVKAEPPPVPGVIVNVVEDV